MRRDPVSEVLEMDGLVPECVELGMRGDACGAGEKETAGRAEEISGSVVLGGYAEMEMNTVRFRHGEDAAVTIEISDEACRRFVACEELADQDRFENLHCEDCPLGMNVGETSLCGIPQVEELIRMRMKEIERNEKRQEESGNEIFD